jgi:hypothetical protein
MSAAAYVGGIGVLGPGLADWPQAAAVLAGELPYATAPTVLPVPALLPPTERRRAGRIVRLALAVGREATLRAGSDAATLASVFSSSGGDGHNCHEICVALALEPREISPTRFSNSVHNAAAGYWSIAAGAQGASNVVCAYDASFSAGLIEALAQVAVERIPVLLIAYDSDYPDPLHAERPIPDAFGAALVLTPRREPGSLARIEARIGAEPPDTLNDPLLEALRVAIPAARCLPLLKLLALGARGRAVLEYLGGTSTLVEVEPCA